MTMTFLDRFRPHRPVPPQPTFEGLAQVRAYWEALRPDAQLPPRSALDPRGLAGVLDRVFLAERIGRGLVQVRIAGSALAEFAGLDLRGLPLSCLFAADSRPRLTQAIESAFHTPAVAEMDLGSDRERAGTVMARLVLLPLAEELGAKLAMGVFGFAEHPASRGKFQLLTCRQEAVRVSPTPDPGAPVQPIRRYGHLALVHARQ